MARAIEPNLEAGYTCAVEPTVKDVKCLQVGESPYTTISKAHCAACETPGNTALKGAVIDSTASADKISLTGDTSTGMGVSVSMNSSKSQSESTTHDTQVSGTNLQAKRIDIRATETDLHMAAAKLQAEDISLNAKRDILLEAAANTSDIKSSNSSSSVGAGVTLAVATSPRFE